MKESTGNFSYVVPSTSAAAIGSITVSARQGGRAGGATSLRTHAAEPQGCSSGLLFRPCCTSVPGKSPFSPPIKRHAASAPETMPLRRVILGSFSTKEAPAEMPRPKMGRVCKLYCRVQFSSMYLTDHLSAG